MAAIGFVYTIARVAEMLGEDEEHLDDLALYMEPEDGRLWVYGTADVPHPDLWAIGLLMRRA